VSYMNFLRDAVRKTHGCEAKHVRSVPVKIRFQGNAVWDGVVEIFELGGHPKASKCYAWGVIDDPDSLKAVTMLHMSPITSAKSAVRAHFAANPPADGTKGNNNPA